ncbi:3-deoxy-7-phosphoheptulonate synthase [Amycolatopsis speibonae]|uniref:Phospho-2-dehydro-3-deoxyheptonate aldolase n=1 Tax=Amycolatopsis speibonae TaxID=1450224 RepID=A0ABV7P0R8_9PSEU
MVFLLNYRWSRWSIVDKHGATFWTEDHGDSQNAMSGFDPELEIAPKEYAMVLPMGHRPDDRVMADLYRRLAAAVGQPAAQQPDWADRRLLDQVVAQLRSAPPIAAVEETDRLRTLLAEVAGGTRFLLQGGDCAETFASNTEQYAFAMADTLKEMREAVFRGAASPVVTVGRMAGQYAKPRSKPVDDSGLPAYRGDMVNSATPDPALRRPDPARLRRAYEQSAITIGRLRKYAAVGEGSEGESDNDIFTSHEALVLDYERALTRLDHSDPQRPRLISTSAHLLWVGERTRQPDGAHIGFASLIANPIGLKIGPNAKPADVLGYVRRLNPYDLPGKLTVICRMGSGMVRSTLPAIVDEVESAGRQVVWACDPMHGNTFVSTNGYKTRHFDDILDEVRGFFEVHAAQGSHPGGLHVEMTGEDVAECIGGLADIRERDFPHGYLTACDPRLNAQQATELAVYAADLLADRSNRSLCATRGAGVRSL